MLHKSVHELYDRMKWVYNGTDDGGWIYNGDDGGGGVYIVDGDEPLDVEAKEVLHAAMIVLAKNPDNTIDGYDKDVTID
jgi:hypothetical protein